MRRRILVYRTGHLGDTVCAIPAFRLIRNFFADAELTLLCDRPRGAKVAVADVIRSLGIFENIVTYTSNHGLLTFLELVRSVRQARPDMVILLPQVRESTGNVQRKKRFFQRCGVTDVRGHLFPVLRHVLQPNEADRLVQMLHSVGVRGTKPAYDIPLEAASRESVTAKLQAVGVEARLPFLVFCGGGKALTQRWDLTRYAGVLKTVADRFHLPVVGIGSEAECARYRAEIKPRFPDLRLPGPLPLPELFELLRGATAYLGNDTGPMHLAAAVGCPVAAVISARNAPGGWDPDVEPHLAIRHRTDCEDCFLTECFIEKHRCLTGITEGMVLSELLPFLEKLKIEMLTR